MKDKILQTALRQFLKFGIREMSIQKLVEPMGISTKTVYKYFKNKEQLLEESLYLFYTQQSELLQELSADQKAIPLFLDVWYTAFEREYKVTNVFFHDLNYYYPELEAKIQRSISKEFTKQFHQLIQKGIEEGVFDTNLHLEVVMESIYVLYDAAARSDRFKPFRASSADILKNTVVTYIKGFCTPKGVRELEEHSKHFKSLGTSEKLQKASVNSI